MLKDLVRNAADLQHKTYPDLKYIVPDILVEGCTVLAGKPKIGKTWLAQDMGLAVAMGGLFMGRQCEQGDVLYLALEDSDRRMQRRLTMMIGANKCDWPQAFQYVTEWPKIGEGCIELMVEWIESVKKPRLIVVDIIKNIRRAEHQRERQQYDQDYEAVAPLRELSIKYQLATLPLHHQRKMGAEDIMDTVSGTLALSGGADNVMVLAKEKESEERFLWSKGRDVEEFSHRVLQDEHMRWQDHGYKSMDEPTSPQRLQIIEILVKAGRSMSIEEIATAIGMNVNAAKQRLFQMLNADEISRPATGRYAALSTQQSMEMNGSGVKPKKPKGPSNKAGHI